MFGNETDFVNPANVVVNVLTKALIKGLLEYLKKEKEPQMVLITETGGFVRFCELLKMVYAAGGAVFNTKGQLLLIRRNDLWDLPKGKLNKLEPASVGALREVEEECNVFDIKLEKKLDTTFHVYFEKKWLVKQTDWYKMTSANWQNAKPQLEEDIQEIKWVDPDNLDIAELDTYQSIRQVLNQLLHQQVDI